MRACLLSASAAALLLGGIGFAAAEDAPKSSLQVPAPGDRAAAAEPNPAAMSDGKPGPFTALYPQTTPSIYSQENAADDQRIIIAHTLGLTDAEKRAIAQALARGARSTTGQASGQPGSELTVANTLPISVSLQDFPAVLTTAMPKLRNYQYVAARGKILIVAPANRIVVGEVAK
jgi:hypothetical protein